MVVRVLHDSKQLSLKNFAYLCEKMVAVEDQLKNGNNITLKQSK